MVMNISMELFKKQQVSETRCSSTGYVLCVCDFHFPGLGVGGEIESEVLVELKTAILSSHVFFFAAHKFKSSPEVFELPIHQSTSCDVYKPAQDI